MKAHELARKLLEGPDLPVVARLDDESFAEVTEAHERPAGKYLVWKCVGGFCSWAYSEGPANRTRMIMTASTLLTRITDLADIINDPRADNTAGRKETLRYEVLPKLLVDNVNVITAALREKVQREEQPNLFN